ncbi:MAG: hypothetical protein C0605_05490 [Hyphomicrobiales bacterium]|nr:MAG: hypothetical protein C0605_05490 [Hyphomicrobiales bacterium]
MEQLSSHPVVNRFWNTLGLETSRALSESQREEISMAIERANPTSGNYSDVRFTIAGRFIVLLWGRERRSSQRLATEAAVHPILAAKNLPILAAIAGTIISVCYVALHGSGRALLTLMN